MAKWKVTLTCEEGHEQTFWIEGMEQEMAESYGRILDGTDEMYVSNPRRDPNSTIGHCQAILIHTRVGEMTMKKCGALFMSNVELVVTDPATEHA